MIPQGVEVYIATEPVDMRFGFERRSGLVRERMGREPRSRALFVFIGKRKHTPSPTPTRPYERSVRVSEAVFAALFSGLSRVVLN